MVYLTPFARLPFDWTIDHVAVLLGARRWLRTKIGTDGQRVATTSGHFVNAVDLASLNASATRAAAR